MDAALQEAREVHTQVDRIITQFAADPEGPLDGSIHSGLRLSPTLSATQEIINIAAPCVPVQAARHHGLDINAEENRFQAAIKDYEETAKDKYKTGVNVSDTHSVAQLWQIIDEAVEKYTLDAEEGPWGRIRAGFRKLGDGSEAMQGWLGLLPSESHYLSVVCGGLKLILKAASRLRGIAEKILNELARIPAILSSVQRVLNIFPKSKKLNQLSDAIYHCILVALGRMLEYLKRKPSRKFGKALFKQQSYELKLESAIENIAAKRDEFNEEAEICHKESTRELQDTIAHETGRKEQARSTQMIQEYLDLRSHNYSELMRQLNIVKNFFEVIRSGSNVIEIAYNDVKRLPENDRPVRYHTQRRPSLLERIQKPKVRPSQARKDLLRQLDYDREVTGQDVALNYQIGPTLNKDEQERCLYAIKSASFTQWIQSESSSVLVINGSSTSSGNHKSGLSFLCARLIYSLDQIRFGGKTDSAKITRPEVVPIHFFCGGHPYNDVSESWESPSGVANSLVAQLMYQCQDVDISQLQPSRYLELDDTDVQGVLSLLRLLIGQLPSNFIVFCIVDALSFYVNNDEVSKSAQRLVAGLLRIAQSRTRKKSRANFKLLLTAPNRLRTAEVAKLDKQEVLNIPKALPDTSGLTAMKWDRLAKQQLKEV